MNFSTNISIVIPAYNEEIGIAKTLAEICQEQKLEGSEIIVVNDGSTDDTAIQVMRFPRIRLISQHKNRGYGASIARGIMASTRNYVIWYDADRQHRVEDLIAVAEKLVADKLDFCIGVRDSQSYDNPLRIPGKLLLKWAVRLATGQAVKDFNSGLRGFRKGIISQYLNLLPKGFGASTATSLLMIERDHFGAEVPIIVNKRIGKSNVKQLRDGLRSFFVILRILVLFKPLRFFGSFGILMIIPGSVYGLIETFTKGLGFPIFATLVIILGVQALFFGLLADQISALRISSLGLSSSHNDQKNNT